MVLGNGARLVERDKVERLSRKALSVVMRALQVVGAGPEDGLQIDLIAEH
jgi:hypothetical protein